ncbi:MAG: hypothetical protein ACI9U0_001975 [Flavobacteriales bacterium]|jgi:hypothetical protein|tara:strand:+ start:3272 stop:3601 length:330 start_codon:yes stop_codon:yes gene_type:complete
MILFGRKDKHIGTREIPNEICVECGKKGGVVSVFQIFFHIALIPVIPISRKIASQCYSCRVVKVEKQFSIKQREVSVLLKKEFKTPLWTLIGASIIFILLLYKLILKWV